MSFISAPTLPPDSKTTHLSSCPPPTPPLPLQNQCASALGSAVLRCDKLDRDEIKNLLMCFLHILKSMSEGRTGCCCANTRARTRAALPLSQSSPSLTLFSPHFVTPPPSRGPFRILEQSGAVGADGLLHVNRVRTTALTCYNVINIKNQSNLFDNDFFSVLYSTEE